MGEWTAIYLRAVYDAQHHDFGALFNCGLALFLCFSSTRRFLTVRRLLTVCGSRFALTAPGGCCGGLIIFLHLVGGSRVPNGITSGWDQVRVEPGKPIYNKDLFSFLALYIYIMENMPRNLFYLRHGELSILYASHNLGADHARVHILSLPSMKCIRALFSVCLFLFLWMDSQLELVYVLQYLYPSPAASKWPKINDKICSNEAK